MNAITKLYGALEISAPSDTELCFKRPFKASAQLVFDAHTKPELVRRWLLGPDGWTMPVCEIDLRVGGTFRYVWKKADRTMGMGGTYLEIEAPAKIVHTELFDEDWTGGETTCTLMLEENGGRTEMTLIVVYPSKEARDGAMATGMAEGMEGSYERLEAILA
ncbi:activator of Hsp90 ATPase 1-like family protein [Asticcacaulis biprosthecium C19]|uniref:Activator of Hsp90 ATPase 1-like family protein n=1 Tax=Asticcacaulis biprosthecium C19 TaxID=715226 RepID=F4QQF8_9CAUL|nr:SRPBCC family protein [Asticcacaulis biprosthecium]EGF90445.1 activator of Hsp90 ATPase 1-like family protein [Asticcacaulis biprosthecium C19]